MTANRVMILREAVGKIVQILAGRSIRVTQMGAGAFVEYDPMGRPLRVNIPYIPDNAPEELIEAVQGFVDHEVGHLLFSDFVELNKHVRTKLGPLHGIVEDTFVERKMRQRFTGTAHNLNVIYKTYIERILGEELKKAVTPQDCIRVLMVPIVRAWAGQEFFQKYMEDKWSKVTALTDRIKPDLIKQVGKADSTQDTFKIAQAIMKALEESGQGDDKEGNDGQKKKGKPQNEKGSKPQNEKGKGEPGGDDSESSEGSEGGEPSEEQESDGKPGGSSSKLADSKKGDKEKESKDDGKSEDGSKDKGSKDEGSEADADSEDEGDSSDGDSEEAGEQPEKGADDDAESEKGAGEDLEDSSEDLKDEEEEADESEEADEKEETEAEEEEGEGKGSDGESSEDEEAEEEKTTSGEKDGDEGDDEGDEGERADQEIEAGRKEGEITPEEMCNSLSAIKDFSEALSQWIGDYTVDITKAASYKAFTKDNDTIEPLALPRGEFDFRHVKTLEDAVGHMIGPIQKDLERSISAQSRSFWKPGQRSGKLHAANLHRLRVEDSRVFRKLEEHTAKDAAVSLVVDCSGSMAGDKIVIASQAAYALASTLDRMNIPNEVIGFTTGRGGSRWSLTPSEVEASRGVYYSRYEPIVMPLIKGFDEKITTEHKKRFAWMPHASGQMFMNNIDGESLEYAAQRLAKRREKRKIMIVLSDGAPACNGDSSACAAHTKQVVKTLENSGMEVFGIGIMSRAVQHFYTKNAVIDDVNSLPAVVMNQLKQALLHP